MKTKMENYNPHSFKHKVLYTFNEEYRNAFKAFVAEQTFLSDRRCPTNYAYLAEAKTERSEAFAKAVKTNKVENIRIWADKFIYKNYIPESIINVAIPFWLNDADNKLKNEFHGDFAAFLNFLAPLDLTTNLRRHPLIDSIYFNIEEYPTFKQFLNDNMPTLYKEVLVQHNKVEKIKEQNSTIKKHIPRSEKIKKTILKVLDIPEDEMSK